MKFKASSILLAVAAASSLFCGSATVHAAKEPRPLLTDGRVRQVPYDPNQVFEIVGTYGYQTAIEFASDESVKVVTLGDSIAWQTVPYQNRLFIKPVEENAKTNLTVITDKRTYYFELNSSESKRSASMTYLVRFVYPNAGIGMSGQSSTPPKPTTASFDPATLNMDYATAIEREGIRLNRAFDDGQFTYFLFEAGSDVPAVYTVEPDGTESIVNARREGPYWVVERMASLFTLRSGEAISCVKNNAKPYKPAPQKTARLYRRGSV